MRRRFSLLLTAGLLYALPASADPSPAYLVKNIHAGAGGGVSSPLGFRDVGGITLFAAQTLETGRELWRSDGTAAGTSLLKDIRPGSESSSLADFAGEVLEAVDARANLATVTTDRRVLVFRATTGTWEERRRTLR